MNLKSYYIFALAGLIVFLFAGKSFTQNKSDLLPIVENNLWGFIDTKGKFVIKPQFARARSFSDGLAQINSKIYDDWEYIDKMGNITIPAKYNSTGNFT